MHYLCSCGLWLPAEPDIAVTYDVSGRQPDTYQVMVPDFPETFDALLGPRANGS